MYRRLASWIGDKPWFRPIARRTLPAVDRVLVKRFGWRATPWPTLLLTTTGRHSGQHRDAPLYFVDHAGERAVIATNYGRAEPAWSLNLRSHPRCHTLIKRTRMRCRARLATEEEWTPIFERFAGFYPSYRAYRERANREIPIWILEGDR